MSKTLLKQADQVQGLKRGPHAVLRAIAWFAFDHGKTCPKGKSFHQLETRCRYQPRTIQAHIGTLEAAGAIKVERRAGMRSVYEIKLEWLATAAGMAESAPVDPRKSGAEPTQILPGLAPEPTQILPDMYTREEEHKEEGRKGEAPASPPPAPIPSPDEILVVGKEASGIEEEPSEAPEPELAEPTREERQLIAETGCQPEEVREPFANWARGGKRHLLPDDWAPSAAGRAYARERGLDPAVEVQRMANMAHARGWRMVDWSARFRQWCDEEPGWAAKRAVRQTHDERQSFTLHNLILPRLAELQAARGGVL